MAYRTKAFSASFTFHPQHRNALVTTAASAIVATLPDARAVYDKNIPFVIKKVDSGAGTVVITPVSSQTIDGSSTFTLDQQNQSVVLLSDGSNWQKQADKDNLLSRVNTWTATNSFAATNGTVVTASTELDVKGAAGEFCKIKQITELITLAAAATSTSVAQLLPANALVLGVVGRVTVTTSTTASLSIGDGTTAARFGSGILIAAGTTFASFLQFNPTDTNAQGPVQTGAQNIVITPNAQPGDALGRVRVTVFYVELTAPTS